MRVWVDDGIVLARGVIGARATQRLARPRRLDCPPLTVVAPPSSPRLVSSGDVRCRRWRSRARRRSACLARPARRYPRLPTTLDARARSPLHPTAMRARARLGRRARVIVARQFRPPSSPASSPRRRHSASIASPRRGERWARPRLVRLGDALAPPPPPRIPPCPPRPSPRRTVSSWSSSSRSRSSCATPTASSWPSPASRSPPRAVGARARSASSNPRSSGATPSRHSSAASSRIATVVRLSSAAASSSGASPRCSPPPPPPRAFPRYSRVAPRWVWARASRSHA